MALQKPFNISVKGRTIDANEENIISWQVSGDIQVAYKIDVLSNQNNSLVWSTGKVTSFALRHATPPSTLSNGMEYKITITIWNQNNNSITSDADIFQTSTRPVVTLNPVDTVSSFSYLFTATYTQNENVSMRNYTVFLYDDSLKLLDKSPIKTERDLEYLFSNLQSETYYHIEFQATCSKGLIGTSGKVRFYCFYHRPKMNVRLRAKNVENAGIELSWFVVQVIGSSNGSQFINNEKINTKDGTSVWFDDGFSTNGDFTLKVWIENPTSKEDLIILNGSNGQFRLIYDAVYEKFLIYKLINTIEESWQSQQVVGNSYIVTIQQINKEINLIAEAIT